jgi:hypothetical protein
MAVIKKNIFGDLSGRLGNYTYRVRNGKLVQYRRPIKQRVSRSKAAVSARNDFAMTVKFAVFINSFPALKQLWKNAKVTGSTHFQKIIKNNSAAVKLFGISVKNIITPPGIGFTVDSLSLTSSNISFNIAANSNELKELFSQSVILHIIIYFHKPKSKAAPSFCFNALVTESPIHDKDFNLDFVPGVDISNSIKKYNSAVVYISASSLNPGKQKYFWTSTFSEEINF